MIYDSFNEALDSMRPFGIRGKPLPWKTNSLKISSVQITEENMEKILGLAIAKVLKWGSFLCGFIPERIETPNGEVINIDEEYLNQIKEDRLQQMLENEVTQNRAKSKGGGGKNPSQGYFIGSNNFIQNIHKIF